jgi:hypothetical protein
MLDDEATGGGYAVNPRPKSFEWGRLVPPSSAFNLRMVYHWVYNMTQHPKPWDASENPVEIFC